MDPQAHHDKWARDWRRARELKERPARVLLEGAVPVGGKIFYWRGEPYLAAQYADVLRA